MSISIWIVLGVVAVVLLWGIISYNRLIAVRQHCDQAFADIDVQLKQRRDLVPNLVETVKGYAGHERAALKRGRESYERRASAEDCSLLSRADQAAPTICIWAPPTARAPSDASLLSSTMRGSCRLE